MCVCLFVCSSNNKKQVEEKVSRCWMLNIDNNLPIKIESQNAWVNRNQEVERRKRDTQKKTLAGRNAPLSSGYGAGRTSTTSKGWREWEGGREEQE